MVRYIAELELDYLYVELAHIMDYIPLRIYWFNGIILTPKHRLLQIYKKNHPDVVKWTIFTRECWPKLYKSSTCFLWPLLVTLMCVTNLECSASWGEDWLKIPLLLGPFLQHYLNNINYLKDLLSIKLILKEKLYRHDFYWTGFQSFHLIKKRTKTRSKCNFKIKCTRLIYSWYLTLAYSRKDHGPLWTCLICIQGPKVGC